MVPDDSTSLSDFYSVATEVSILLAKCQMGDVDKTITEVLGILGRHAKVERSYVFTFRYEEGLSYYDYEWCAEGVTPEIDTVGAVEIEVLADWVAAFRKGEHVHIPSIPDMTDCDLKELLASQEIKSLIVYPMFHGKELLGFVGFDAVADFRIWDEADVSLLKIACDTLGSTLSGKRYREELVAAKEAAEQANAYKSEFLANMSHELRSPLNSVIGFSELIELEYGEQCYERIGEYAGLIKAGGKHLLGMINDILDLTRIESGRMDLEYRVADVAETLELVYSLMRVSAEQKGVELLLELPDEPICLWADERRLHQVVHNLLSNAVKFTPEGKRAGIYARWLGDRVEIEVWDEGRGIPKEWQNRVFEPFEQVENSDAEVGGGSGLGLAIVKKIVDLHGGNVSLESEIGKGSTFTISFDAKHDDERSLIADNKGAFAAQIDGQGHRILYVDDIEANRKLMASALERCEFEVDTATNGLDGVAKIEESKYDVVLLDIKLPDIDGFEVFRRMKKIRPDQRVIAVTASLTPEIKDRIVEIGFDGIQGKPVNFEALLDSMAFH